MPAGKYDFVIEQGATFTLTLTLTRPNKLPLNLTGYQVKAVLKRPPPDTSRIAVITSTIQNPPSDGKIVLSIPYTETKQMNFINGIYDVVLKAPTGEVVRVLQGKVTFSPEVTSWD